MMNHTFYKQMPAFYGVTLFSDKVYYVKLRVALLFGPYRYASAAYPLSGDLTLSGA